MLSTTRESFTEDSLLGGKITLRQPQKGYRVSQDAVLLAALTEVRPGQRVLELGTGYGQVALCLAHFHPDIHVTAVELLPEAADYARYNVRVNGLSDRIDIFNANVKGLAIGQKFDVVVFNPPYRKPAEHSLSSNEAKNYANYEMDGVTLADWVETARRHSDNFCFIHDARRYSEFEQVLGSKAAYLFISGGYKNKITRVLVKVPGSSEALPTLYLRSAPQLWQPAVAAAFMGQQTLVKLWGAT
jgi:tRNA1(Val) A37 N6-methylase TrmN6